MQWLKAEPSALKVSVLPRPQEVVASLAMKAQGLYVLWVEEHAQTHQHVPRVVVLMPQEISWWGVGLDDAFSVNSKINVM